MSDRSLSPSQRRLAPQPSCPDRDKERQDWREILWPLRIEKLGLDIFSKSLLQRFAIVCREFLRSASPASARAASMRTSLVLVCGEAEREASCAKWDRPGRSQRSPQFEQAGPRSSRNLPRDPELEERDTCQAAQCALAREIADPVSGFSNSLQGCLSAGGALSPTVEGFGEVLGAWLRAWIPALDRIFGPCGGLVRVALIAGVGCPEYRGAIRTGNSHRMVVAGVHAHVCGGRHVARDTFGRRWSPMHGDDEQCMSNRSGAWHWAQTRIASLTQFA